MRELQEYETTRVAERKLRGKFRNPERRKFSSFPNTSGYCENFCQVKSSDRPESSRGKTSSQVESTHIRIFRILLIVCDVHVLLDVGDDLVQLLLDVLLLNLLADCLKLAVDNETRKNL